MHRFCIVCFALLGSFTPNAWTWEYRTSWIGNTFGGKDGNFVQMDTRTLFVAPDGTCFLNVPWEEDGNNAGLYRDGQHVSNPGRTHGWGNTGGFAVVANDRYIFIAQSRNSEGGHLHERDPESYPPGGVAWFGLTRRTLASGGKEAAPAPGGKGSGLEIQGLGEDTLAQLAGSFLVINEEPESRDAHIRGLALDNNRGRLYVSNPAKSRIEFYDPETLEKRGEWPIEDTRQMTVGPDGSLWVVVGKIDAWGLPGSAIPGLPSTWAMPTADQLRGFAKIVRFSPDGQLLPQAIEDAGLPTGLAFDPQGRLLVADNGPDQQVRIYDVSGEKPQQVATFGERGGILSGVRGQVAPLKFNGLQGVGTDSQGNIYVACNGFGGNGSGMTLESYQPDGTLRWALHGLEFVDVGDFDRANDGKSIFTAYERFAMDYSKTEPGTEWTYAGYTLDRERFPYDPRIHGRKHNTAWIRTVDGRRFMFGTDMYSKFVTIFRFESNSEIAIPCGMFMKGTDREGMHYPPHRPQGRFIWIDQNGNGQFEAEEIEHDGKDEPETWAWWVDSRGHIWQGYQDASCIVEFPLNGVSEHGVPLYSRQNAIQHRLPAPFDEPHRGSRVERVKYYPERDVMLISGYTPEKPAPGGAWKTAGRVIVRYNNWSKQPVKTWEIYPHFSWQEDVASRETPASFDLAGDFLFVIESHHAVTTIYDAKSGMELAKMSPGPEVGNYSGWIDIPYGINPVQRQDGEYLMLAEEDGRAKNILYRFRKPTNVAPPQAVSGLKAEGGRGHIVLSWNDSDRASGYIVERRTPPAGTFQFLSAANRRSAHKDNSVQPDRQYEYRVVAVGWGGASPASAVVRAEAVQAQGQGDLEEESILYEDFESGSSALSGIDVVPMPDQKLEDGGDYVGNLGHGIVLPIRADIPLGTQRLIIEYDRLYLELPAGRVHTHYTRQYVRFDITGDERHGEATRFVLDDAQAGRWQKIRLEIPIPEGALYVTGGELANIAEQAADGYENPVFIDNLRIFFE